jgi:hypothetical protein
MICEWSDHTGCLLKLEGFVLVVFLGGGLLLRFLIVNRVSPGYDQLLARCSRSEGLVLPPCPEGISV